MNFRLLLLVLLSLQSAVARASDAPWHHPLYLSGGGYWPTRVAIIIENNSDAPVAGEPVTAEVPALTGERVESLRVCNAAGQDLLFGVSDTANHPKRTGRLAASDRIVLPAECPPKSSATVYVYAGNDAALAVPDFLKHGFVNGDFESGADTPDAWVASETDEHHRVTWEKSGGRSGACGRVEVDAGAAPTWVKWMQHGIPVTPGRTYKFTAWVRAENVVGRAGWFIHVDGDKPQLLNKSIEAGEGNFDWKQVSATFTAPDGAKTATVGTILRGTGRAWFDDATFEGAGDKSKLRATTGAVEHLHLQALDSRHSSLDSHWPYRTTVRVFNLTDQLAADALVYADLRAARKRLRALPPNASIRVIDPATGKALANCVRLNDSVLFRAAVPPRSAREFHLDFSATRTEQSDDFLAAYEQIVAAPLNLAPNPSFERGADRPEGWKLNTGPSRTAGISSDARFGQRSAELVAPADNKNWVGWQSAAIPVQPGATYFYGGFLKTAGATGTVTLHAHLHDKNARVVSSGFVSTLPQLSGDAGWTNTMTFVHAPADAATITLHLTMNCGGTVRHDGILLCRALQGEVTGIESAESMHAAADLRVWEMNPLVKVFPDDLPGAAARSVTVECARNEYEPFQLVLRSSRKLTGVQVAVSSLTNGKGAALPPVKVERVGFVPIDHPSSYYQSDAPDWQRRVPRGKGFTDGWAGEWPDPLVPNSPFELAANRAQPMWFTVRATRDTTPGVYRGEVTIRAAGTKTVKLPVRINVLPFALPERTRLKVIFDFRTNASASVRRQWLRFMAEHRLGISAIEPQPEFIYKDGKVAMDAAAFDEAARYCFDELGMQVSYTPAFFYMFGWAYPPKKLFGLEPFTPEYNAAFKQAYKLFSDHVKAKGWHDKFVYYISDEPHFYNHEFVVEQMKKLCALIHEVDPVIPIYSSTWRHCPEWDDSLDLWGVGQYGCFPVAELDALRKRGKQFWFTCDGQMATDTPYLGTERLLPYYCFKYGATGFEFWGINWWTYDPWERGWHTFIRQSDDGKRYYWVRYPNGDGYLTYPGGPVGVDGPVSTIRLDQIREGLEDYEALAMLSELVEKAKQSGKPCDAAERALAMARELVTIPNAGGYRSTDIMPNPDRVPAVRKAVNAAIMQLMAK